MPGSLLYSGRRSNPVGVFPGGAVIDDQIV